MVLGKISKSELVHGGRIADDKAPFVEFIERIFGTDVRGSSWEACDEGGLTRISDGSSRGFVVGSFARQGSDYYQLVISLQDGKYAEHSTVFGSEARTRIAGFSYSMGGQNGSS